MPERTLGSLPPLAVAAFTPRDRTRETLRRALPRRAGSLVAVKSADALGEALRAQFVDAVVVDLVQPTPDAWAAAALARDFPSVPFFAYLPIRPGEMGGAARALQLDFADLLLEGSEDPALREVMRPASVTVRFATALQGADPHLGLTSPLQRQVWRYLVAQGGRLVRTEEIAAEVGCSREHLSRRFAADGAPNLKRVIDLVRLLAAADLAKNPGIAIPDVARILGFASASHLGLTCERLLGVRAASLARLRPAEVMDRFVRQGRSRSRKERGARREGKEKGKGKGKEKEKE